MARCADDPRSVADLFETAFKSDDDAAWDAVAALHWRGSREVLDRALGLTGSGDPFTRARAADVLGQLGIPERSFPDECFDAVLPLLSDLEGRVVSSAIIALQYLDQWRAGPHVIPFAQHRDGEVRQAVAFALGGIDTTEAIETLSTLMQDADAEVRDWATFGLARQTDVDTDAIRTALGMRLGDEDPDVRYEAILGLARRRDSRALGYLKTMLHEEPDIFTREAAARFLGLDDSEDIPASNLLGALQRRQRWSRR